VPYESRIKQGSVQYTRTVGAFLKEYARLIPNYFAIGSAWSSAMMASSTTATQRGQPFTAEIIAMMSAAKARITVIVSIFLS
jgi:hypothetical protein